MVNDKVYTIIVDLECLNRDNIEGIYVDDNGVEAVGEFAMNLVTSLENLGFKESSWTFSDTYDPTLHNLIVMYHPDNVSSRLCFDIRTSDKIVSKLSTSENKEILSPCILHDNGFFSGVVGWWTSGSVTINDRIFSNQGSALDYIKTNVVA